MDPLKTQQALTFVDVKMFKPKTEVLLSIITASVPDPEKYEPYGKDATKKHLHLQGFFDAIRTFYSHSSSEEDKQDHERFFRCRTAQEKYRDAHQLAKDDQADHVISTAVFRDILRFANPDMEYTYDYWASIKTTINQCWNFQRLTKVQNNQKGQTEKELCAILQKGQVAVREVLNKAHLMDYVESIFALMQGVIDERKHLFRQAKSLRVALNSFFQATLGRALNFKDLQPRFSCSCAVCKYCRDNSLRWRVKYYIIYSSPRTPEEYNEFIDHHAVKGILEGAGLIHLAEKFQSHDIKSIMLLALVLNDRQHDIHQDLNDTDRSILRFRLEESIKVAFKNRISRKRNFESIKGAIEESSQYMALLTPRSWERMRHNPYLDRQDLVLDVKGFQALVVGAFEQDGTSKWDAATTFEWLKRQGFCQDDSHKLTALKDFNGKYLKMIKDGNQKMLDWAVSALGLEGPRKVLFSEMVQSLF